MITSSPFDRLRALSSDPALAKLLSQLSPSQLPAPQVNVPTGKPAGTGLLDRLKSNLMPDAQGLQQAGLISPDELDSARDQGFMNIGLSLLANSGPKTADQAVRPFQALGQAIQAGQGAYQGAVQNAAALRSAGQDYQTKQQELAMRKTALEKQQNLDTARHEIISKYPVPTNPADMPEWLTNVLPRFIEVGDDETVGQLSPLYTKLAQGNDRFQQTQVGDAATTFDPRTGKFFDPKTKTWVDAVERHMTPEELALKKAQIANTRANTAANLSLANDRMTNQRYNQFMRDNKTITERAPVLKQALVTMRDAAGDPEHGIPPKPALYTSAVANFIQAADQKAQIRWQLLNYFKSNVDPRISGKWEVLKARLLQGSLPGYTSKDMINHLQKLLALTEQDYAKRRAGAIRRHPELEAELPPSTEYFSDDFSQGYAPTAPSGGQRPSLDDLYQGGQ